MPEGVVLEIKEISYYWVNRVPEPPTGAEDFAVRVQVLIGEVGDEGSDSFDLLVCSPNRLADFYGPERWDEADVLPGENIMPVTGLWLMKTWSREGLEDAFRRVLASYSPGPDFQTVADRIGRLIPWEFDYRHDDAINRAAGLSDPAGFLWHDPD